MNNPQLCDVIELLVDIAVSGLRVGDCLGQCAERNRGAIVEQHSDRAYEVEFTNETGETKALVVLSPEQFMVVWQSATEAWVPITERIAAMIRVLPEERQEEVLSFARSLYQAPV
ncbi:MAG: DUF4926 domain-containing protein [Spirulina sp. SIO3F2]|nr:DUF4926 domain-containing protein [Spirulina sp. SIO3F2]